MVKKLLPAVVFSVAGFISVAFAAVQEKVVAAVNGQAITLSELEEALTPFREEYVAAAADRAQRASKLEEIRREVLEGLINDQVLLLQARKEGIGLSSEEVGLAESEFRQRFPDDKTFERWLEQQRLSPGDFREKLRRQGVIRKLVHGKLADSIEVTTEEARDFYDKNPDLFREGPQVNLGFILVKGPPERSPEEAEAIMLDIEKQLNQGGDFRQMARNYSDLAARESDKFGALTDLPSELRTLIDGLSVGEVSDIIRSPAGFNVIKLYGRRQPGKRDFSEVSDDIKEQIFRQKLEGKYAVWLEGLKKDFFIERK